MKFSPELLVPGLDGSTRSSRRPRRFWVAFSGGLDSTVLLSALAKVRGMLPGPLHAVHVDHNLNPDSPNWARHCQAMSDALDVPLEHFAITVDAAPGASIEAAARDARYEVFRELLDADEALLTAHHQDDQLETFLLQALRGAGPHGLAAMPPAARLGAGWLCRPLLDWPRDALRAWARQQELDWLDDPSNSEDRFNRNYLRKEIVPRLKTRWPAAAQTISRSARHCAQTAALVDELAAADLAACGAAGGTLRVSALRLLDVPRRRNAVRHWLDWQGFSRPSEKKLEHVLSDVLEAAPDKEPCVDWADVTVRRYRDELHAERERPPPRGGTWTGDVFDLGNGWGCLCRVKGAGPGLPDGHVEIRFRQGGEKIRPPRNEHHRELKKLFQEAGVLPWRRAHVPLVYVDNVLAAAGDLWINADIAKTPGWHVRWTNKPSMKAE